MLFFVSLPVGWESVIETPKKVAVYAACRVLLGGQHSPTNAVLWE
jgi:hypothetical protein